MYVSRAVCRCLGELAANGCSYCSSPSFPSWAVLNFGVAWYYSGVLNDLALEVREEEVEYNLIASGRW